MPPNYRDGKGYYSGTVGCLSDIQASLANRTLHAFSVTPAANTIPTPRNMIAFTEVGTHTARTPATTNLATQASRVGYELAATTAGTFAEVYQGTAIFCRSTTPGMGGFAVSYRFVPSDAAAVSGKRQFHGLMASTSALTDVEPTTFVDCFGIGSISTSNNLCLIFNDSAGTATCYDLGSNFPGGSISTDLYTFQFYCAPGGNKIEWSVVNECTGYSVYGTEDSNLPTSGTLLAWHSWVTNHATALKAAFDFCSLDIWTEI